MAHGHFVGLLLLLMHIVFLPHMVCCRWEQLVLTSWGIRDVYKSVLKCFLIFLIRGKIVSGRSCTSFVCPESCRSNHSNNKYYLNSVKSYHLLSVLMFVQFPSLSVRRIFNNLIVLGWGYHLL